MTETPAVDGTAVRDGVLAGLPLVGVALAGQLTLLALSDDPHDAWFLILLGMLLGAFWRAGRRAAKVAGPEGRPLAQGALAGLGVLVVWLPVRLVIAFVGDSEKPFAGVGGAIVLAGFFGMLGALLDLRRPRPGGTGETGGTGGPGRAS